jgi:hypothetical protein
MRGEKILYSFVIVIAIRKFAVQSSQLMTQGMKRGRGQFYSKVELGIAEGDEMKDEWFYFVPCVVVWVKDFLGRPSGRRV